MVRRPAKHTTTTKSQSPRSPPKRQKPTCREPRYLNKHSGNELRSDDAREITDTFLVARPSFWPLQVAARTFARCNKDLPRRSPRTHRREAARRTDRTWTWKTQFRNGRCVSQLVKAHEPLAQIAFVCASLNKAVGQPSPSPRRRRFPARQRQSSLCRSFEGSTGREIEPGREAAGRAQEVEAVGVDEMADPH